MMVRGTPMRQRSERQARLEALRRRIKRERPRICEWCGDRGSRLDLHHVFGRPATGARLGKWADDRSLLMVLCRECHEEATNGGGQLRDKLRCVAEARFLTAHGVLTAEPIVEVIAQLEARGEEPL